ncbi:MAG: Gfo/Idh/MocA family oxidoreductase [Clostridia bacterium]|nr:Gfo/Idh/MocA family oxidoreductase [Clostridia bacterium]
MANKKFRLGMIGCGSIADIHLKNILNIPEIEVVAGVDIIPGRAKALFEKYNIDAKSDYATHEEMINDTSLALDGVSICTYNCEHAGPAIYALDHGINVLLEKPFTVTLDEAVAVMRAEKRSGKILSIGFQPRFEANMQKIKSIVESGELGRVYYVQTGGGRRRGIPTRFGTTFIEKETAGVGALGDIGCYALDMVLNALGNPKPITVSGYKSDFFGKDPSYIGYKEHGEEYSKRFSVDDFAAAFIRLEGDVILDFRISWAMNIDTPGDTIILGTKGGLRIPSTECWNGKVGGAMKIYREVNGEQTEEEIPIIEQDIPCFELKIREFVKACQNGGKSPVPSSEILYNQAIIDGIARSAELGREVEIVIPEI